MKNCLHQKIGDITKMYESGSTFTEIATAFGVNDIDERWL